MFYHLKNIFFDSAVRFSYFLRKRQAPYGVTCPQVWSPLTKHYSIDNSIISNVLGKRFLKNHLIKCIARSALITTSATILYLHSML